MFACKSQRRGPSGLAVFLFCACWSVWAQAGSFQVSPVRTSLSAAQRVGAMTVRNDGPEPTVIQLEVVNWSQEDGKDVYTPTKEILATPPIFTLQPGASQLIRVGLRRSPDPRRELTYRLFMQEVPPPPKPDFQGLQVALRIGVPVFVMPPVRASPVLRWRANAAPNGAIKLTLANDGSAHVQVANFKLGKIGSAVPLVSKQVATYLLPGQHHEWVVEPGVVVAAGSVLHVSAQTDSGDVNADMTLEAP